jgi:tripartite-type tricarboxylate transporter receptor subunit TctC
MVKTVVAALGVLLACVGAASAQNFPSRPINLVVGLAGGGITDGVARIYGEALSRTTGWKTIVENRTGAGGGVAAAYVQNAPPDGQTLLIFSGSQHATIAAMTPGMYQPVAGFAPITVLFDLVQFGAVSANHPANSLDDLFKIARSKSGGLMMGTQGVGSPPHLLGTKLAATAKVPFTPVHYRGGSAMITDLLAGQVDFAFLSAASGGSFVQNGKLKALAIDSDVRSEIFPNTPTLTELGYGNQKVATWFGVAAPAGTPANIVAVLAEQFIKASQEPELRKRLAALATPTRTSTPDEMKRLMSEESAAMQEFVRVFNIRNQ